MFPARGRSRLPRLTRRTAAIVVVSALLGLLAPATTAQTPAPPATGLEVHFPRPWFGPGEPLAMDVAVVNESSDRLENLRLTVALYERARSRTQLRSILGGSVPRTPLEAFTYTIGDLPPGGRHALRIEHPLDDLRGFQGAPDGLYPISMSVRQSTGPALSTHTTAVTMLADTPPVPLRVVPVLVLTPRPLLSASGEPGPEAAARLAELRRELEATLATARPFGLVLGAGLMTELQTLEQTPLRDAAAAVHQLVVQAARTGELLTSTHTHALLPHLSDLERGEDAANQIRGGREAIHRLTEVEPLPLLYPPGLALDSRTLGLLGETGIEATLVGSGVLAAASGGLTPASVASLRGTSLVPADEALQRAVAQGGSGLDLSRIVADTAMVFFESPGRSRVVAVPVVAGEQQTLFGAFVRALHEAPWSALTPPSWLLRADGQRVTAVSMSEAERPPRSYLRSLVSARSAVEDLASFVMDDNPLLASLRSSVEAGRGTAWWSQDWAQGTRWNDEVAAAVRAQANLVGTQATDRITFSSHQGQVPVSVVNRAGYPVRLRLEVESPKLRFPEGSMRQLDPLPPPGRLVTFPALADATGTFPLKVRLTSSDGSVLVDEREVAVRSTAYNVVAMTLTIGAAGFLVVWYAWRLLSRRRKPRPAGLGYGDA